MPTAIDFLIRRVFGPDRLLLLRDDLAAIATGPSAGEAKLATLLAEADEVKRTMDNQALAFDAYPPDHPVARRAAKRIEHLDARAGRIKDEIALLEE